MATKQEIIAKLSNFIESTTSSNNKRSILYVGITEEIERRLFEEHKLNKEENRCWIFGKCSNSNVAREIESYLINKYNTDGNSGGGNDNTYYVYVYKKNYSTNP